MNIATALLLRAPIKWGCIGRKALRQENQRKSDEARRHKVHRSFEYQDLASMQKMNNSGLKRLESLKGAFRYFFDHSSIRLGAMQKQMTDFITVAFLKNMFADDLVSNLKYLCKEFRINELFDTGAILVPRRVCFHLFNNVLLSFYHFLLLHISLFFFSSHCVENLRTCAYISDDYYISTCNHRPIVP